MKPRFAARVRVRVALQSACLIAVAVGIFGMNALGNCGMPDMLGMSSHPHHEQFVPKFCKRYAQIGHIIQEGLLEYKRDVESGAFPGTSFSPYHMKDDEKEAFEALLAVDASERERKHQKAAASYTDKDEYEKLHLYGSKNGEADG